MDQPIERVEDISHQHAVARQAVLDVLGAEGITPVTLGTMVASVELLTEVIVGPRKKDWTGAPLESGERDQEQGVAHKADRAFDLAIRLDKAMSNGGVPAKLSPAVKAAIWVGASTVVAAGVTAIATILANGGVA